MVEHIASYLPSSSLFAFRLACRDLDAKTFHHLGEQHFSTKRFTLSFQSLQRLVDISQDEDLRQYMKTVVLGTEALPQTPPTNIDMGKLSAYRDALNEQ